MNLLIFGSGNIYKENKKYISKDDVVVGFLDNNLELLGKQIDNVVVYHPDDVLKLSYDKIVLMSVYALEMYRQLLDLGCKKEDILHYKEYINQQNVREMTVLFSEKNQLSFKGMGLIITTTMGFNGGSIAAVNAAIALNNCGYKMAIASPEANPLFIQEVRKKGIDIILYKNLTFAKEEELIWTENFQFILVNTLQMTCCAIEIAKHRKVILWLHEASNYYMFMRYWEEKIKKGIELDQLKVYAVSSIAKNNFKKNYPEKKIALLPYGIPQKSSNCKKKKIRNFVFAMFGYVSEQKGQDIFLDAVEKVSQRQISTEFWIAGKMPNDNYVNQMKERVKQFPYVKILGELIHDEIIELYNEIDVLVVASREDMLPMVATEAMMFEKVCIVSDATGTINYIKEYENGLIFPKENADELAEKMLWCIENQDKLKSIGKQARKTYEQNFSMEVFELNLKSVISK